MEAEVVSEGKAETAALVEAGGTGATVEMALLADVALDRAALRDRGATAKTEATVGTAASAVLVEMEEALLCPCLQAARERIHLIQEGLAGRGEAAEPEQLAVSAEWQETPESEPQLAGKPVQQALPVFLDCQELRATRVIQPHSVRQASLGQHRASSPDPILVLVVRPTLHSAT
jgi:hypothetical protein